MMRQLTRILLLCLMLGSLTSCLIRVPDMGAKFDPSGKNCITIGEALDLRGGAGSGYEIKSNAFVKTASKPLIWLYTYVRYVTWVSTKGLYQGISENPMFRRVLNALGTAMIALYSIALLLGIIQYNLNELMMNIFKLAIVYGFALNWEPFETVIFHPLEGEIELDPNGGYKVLEEGGVAQLVKMASFLGVEDKESKTPTEDVVGQMDNVLFMLAGWNYWKLIFALLATGLQGWLYAGLLTAMLITYFWAVVSAFQIFLVSMIARCLLYSVAPLFFVCLLFKATRQLFMGWAEQILSYSLQPIFLFLWLGIINAHIVDFIAAIPVNADKKICYDAFISFPMVSIIPKLNWWIFADGTKKQTELRGAFAGVQMHFWFMAAAVCLSVIMHQMLKWTIEVAKRISGGAASIGGVEAIGYETVKNSVMSPFYQGLGFLGGAFGGGRDPDGVKRKGGLVGTAWKFAQGKGIHPINDVFGGAMQRWENVRRSQVGEITSILNREFGLGPKSGGNAPWKAGRVPGTKDLESIGKATKKFFE